MTYPKKRPCPQCKAPGDELSVYRYDHGGQHVECDAPGCFYLGPCAGSILGAIRLHNDQSQATA